LPMTSWELSWEPLTPMKFSSSNLNSTTYIQATTCL
jgi:hypothetical protein